MADRVEIVVGAALDLPTLSGTFDFVFIDADGEQLGLCELGETGAGRARVIVVDNVVRDRQVLAPAPDDAQARAVRDMLEMMGRHPRLDTAAIQTVGVRAGTVSRWRWSGDDAAAMVNYPAIGGPTPTPRGAGSSDPRMAPLPGHVVQALQHGPQADPTLLEFDSAPSLLDPSYHQTENGYGTLRDGGFTSPCAPTCRV